MTSLITNISVSNCKHDINSINQYAFTHCYIDAYNSILPNKITVSGMADHSNIKVIALRSFCDIKYVKKSDLQWIGQPQAYQVMYQGEAANLFGKAGLLAVFPKKDYLQSIVIGNDPSWMCDEFKLCYRPLRGSSKYIYSDGMYLEFYQTVTGGIRDVIVSNSGTFSIDFEMNGIDKYDSWFFYLADSNLNPISSIYSEGILIQPVISSIGLTDINITPIKNSNYSTLSAKVTLNDITYQGSVPIYIATDTEGIGLTASNGTLISMEILNSSTKLYTGLVGLYINTIDSTKRYYHENQIDITIDIPEFHKACVNNICTQVPGVGTDECTVIGSSCVQTKKDNTLLIAGVVAIIAVAAYHVIKK